MTKKFRCRIGLHRWKYIRTGVTPMSLNPDEHYRYCQDCRHEEVYHYDSQGGWYSDAMLTARKSKGE